MGREMSEIELVNWSCQIGEIPRYALPSGSDGPMRDAVQKAYYDLTKISDLYIFSGWGEPLPEVYRAVVENREPICPTCGRH